MSLTLEFVMNFLKLLDAMSLYVILGLGIAGVLKQVVPDNFVSSHLGKSSTSSVLKATIFGIPLPVCSCSVIPLAQSLRKEGASKGSVQSFLISAPITGVDSILATFSFFGLIFTAFRIISSLIIAIIVGLLQNFFEKEDNIVDNVKSSTKLKTKVFTISKPDSLTKSENLVFSSSNFSKKSKKKSFSLKEVFTYGYGVLFKDMAKSLLIGLLLGALFTTFMPQEYAKLLFDNQVLTYIVILLFAMPLYTCATASLPLAAALMLQGMSAGAVFIFLTAGPATSAVTMSVVYKMLGKKALIVYVSTIASLALVFGFAFDTFFSDLNILNISHDMDETSFFSSLSSLLMLILISYHLFKEKFSKKKDSCCS